MLKAVVHVNFEDSERQGNGLRNISNVLEAAPGPCEIHVVCHGAGIRLLVRADSELGPEIEKLSQAGVHFKACRNTLESKSIDPTDLVPHVEVVPSGALEVISLQQAGYAYFKP